MAAALEDARARRAFLEDEAGQSAGARRQNRRLRESLRVVLNEVAGIGEGLLKIRLAPPRQRVGGWVGAPDDDTSSVSLGLEMAMDEEAKAAAAVAAAEHAEGREALVRCCAAVERILQLNATLVSGEAMETAKRVVGWEEGAQEGVLGS